MAEFASAIVALSVEFGRTGKKLRYYTKTLSHAKEEMADVLSDTKTCGNVLLLFGNALAEEDSPMAGEVHRLRIDADLQHRSECLLNKLKTILVKRLKPMNKRNGTSALQRGTARCLWLFQKEEVGDLKKELGYVSALVHMCISLVTYGKLKNTMGAMDVVPEELRGRMKALEKSIKTQAQACIRTNEILAEQAVTQAAQTEMIREMSQLLERVTQLAEREITESKEHRREKRRLSAREPIASIVSDSDSTSQGETSQQIIPQAGRPASPPTQIPRQPSSAASQPSRNFDDASEVAFADYDMGYCNTCGFNHISRVQEIVREQVDRDLNSKSQSPEQTPEADTDQTGETRSFNIIHECVPERPRILESEERSLRREEKPQGGKRTDDTDEAPPEDDGDTEEQ